MHTHQLHAVLAAAARSLSGPAASTSTPSMQLQLARSARPRWRQLHQRAQAHSTGRGAHQPRHSHGRRAFSELPQTRSPATSQQPATPPSSSDTQYGIYSNPTMHTVGVASKLLRYSIYASCAIVFGGSAIYFSVHAYIEYSPSALHGWSRIPPNDIFLPEELVPSFSGAHLGGGTDSAVPWWGRLAARAAWMSLNYSPGVATPGGVRHYREVEIPDKTWLEAEAYLKVALDQIAGMSDENIAKAHDADRELRTFLADIQSKLGGPRGLREARDNFARVLQAVELASINSPVTAARRLHLQRNLAQIETRLGNLNKQDDTKSRQRNALERLSEQLYASLGGEGSNSKAEALLPERPASARVPPVAKSGIAGWFSSSSSTAPKESVVASTVVSASSTSSHVSALCHLLGGQETPQSPPVQRASAHTALELVRLSAALGDSATSATLCSSLSGWLKRTTSLTPSSTDSSLHAAMLHSYSATAESFLAELYTAAPSLASSSGQQPLALAEMAIQSVEKSLQILDLNRSNSVEASLAGARKMAHDAVTRTAALAYHTRGTLQELRGQDIAVVLQDYEKAHAFAASLADPDSANDSSNRTLQAVRRCREKLSSTAAKN